MQRIDLTGKRFGKLVVDEMLYNYNGTKRTKCLCHCDCGKKNILRNAYTIQHSELSSCGCGKKEVVAKSCGKDINGQRFGRLVVLETYWNENPPKVKCRCDCGNVVVLRKHDVQSYHAQSCGCITLDRLEKLNDVDHSGKVSDYGIEIVRKSKRNKYNQWLWKCKCGCCGEFFDELPARILNNHVRSCGCLKSSSSEMMIENHLKDIGASFERQYSFEDCISRKGYHLKFDFAIFKDNKLLCLIEYDGKQHFEPVEWFGGEKGFKESIERDNVKNKYCQDHDITLYRFDYTMEEHFIKEQITNIIYP